jgi:hypothetical protein
MTSISCQSITAPLFSMAYQSSCGSRLFPRLRHAIVNGCRSQGIGHELPQLSWDTVIPAIIRHTACTN